MKKLYIILLFFISLVAKSQLAVLVMHTDTLLSFNPSTGVYIQLTKLVPSQSGQSGKYLSTDGTNYTWIAPVVISGKLNTSDTASMLANYLTGIIGVPVRVKYSDTTSMLSAYLTSIIANTSAISGKAASLTIASDATNADFTIAVNSVKYLPAATLSTNHTITFPTGSNGDYIEIYNNEAGFVWLLSGGAVYQSDGTTTITQLMANTNYIIRKVSSKWRIAN